MLCRVALVRTDVIISVTRIGEQGTLAVHTIFLRSVIVTANVGSSLLPFTLMMGAMRSSETLVLRRATQRNISEVSYLSFPFH
jgi:hypothetical protein